MLDDQEPRQLLAELGQARADELKAGDDVAHVARGAELTSAVRELVKHRDRMRRSARDLARGHGARQLRHWLTSTSRAHGGAGCSGIRLLGGFGLGSRDTHACMVCPQDRSLIRYGPDYARSAVCNRDVALDRCGSDAAVTWDYPPQ